jgi:arginyl-tRNA synthetase
MTEDKDEIAQAVGIGAVKYNDLKQNPKTEIIFDWEQMISLSGNSGPYLQYTYARIESIFRKKQGAGNSEQGTVKKTESNVSDEELLLLRTLYLFSEVIEESAKEFSPNILCNFLFDLAQKFNNFYDKEKIIGSKNEEFKLVLAKAVGQIIKNGLTILGIKTVEKM